jgi:septal ring factor EnvC (AmiA/AmiB activator)
LCGEFQSDLDQSQTFVKQIEDTCNNTVENQPENEIENEKVINITEIHDNSTTEVKFNADNAAILQLLHALESKVAECHMEYTHIIDALIETIDQLKTNIETREKTLDKKLQDQKDRTDKMISKMHVDMDLNTKAVRHVTENDQVVNNILKGLEKTIIDLSHTNESESTPKDTREINEIDLSDRGQIEKVETDNMGPEKTDTELKHVLYGHPDHDIESVKQSQVSTIVGWWEAQ